jgi:glycosyltransferase involved in cell wall biosynthesis
MHRLIKKLYLGNPLSHSSNLPMVSVLMPSFNQARYISESIASVLDQSHQRLELIVADGGSADGTLEILRDWHARDERVRWFTGVDAGPADALNKAMAKVRGTVVGWLNSDDVYAAGSVERAVATLQQEPDAAAVYGHGQHVDERGNLLGDYPTLKPNVPVRTFLDGCFICQPTMFLNRSACLLLGPFDSSLKTAFDFDYWLRLFNSMPGRVAFVDAVQAQSRMHAECITRRMRREVALEGMSLLRRHLGRAPVHWALTHIDEILAGASPRDASSVTRGQIADFVHATKAFLTPGHYQNLTQRWG